MPLPFQSDLDRQQKMLDDLERSRQPQISPAIQDAIIGVESAGNPNAVGDVGARAGSSTGLMQIQSQTARDLYKQGKLPKVWNGKKVKKKDLSELLKDPEFNKQAGAALYEDNRKVLRRSAKRRGVEVSPEQEEDLLIKAHNQGMTKTLKRDLYGEEPLNPKVQKYLDKVKGRMVPVFEDGGAVYDPDLYTLDPSIYQPEEVIDPLDESRFDLLDPALQGLEPEIAPDIIPEEVPVEEEPAASPQADLYQQMMDEYAKEKDQHKKDKKAAAIADFAASAVGAIGQYGVSKGAAEAQAASGMRFQAPDLGFKGTELVKGLKSPNLKEYLSKVKMMKDLRSLKDGGGKASDILAREKFDYQKEKDKIGKLPTASDVLGREKFEYKKKQDLLGTGKTKTDYTIGGVRYSGKDNSVVNRGNYSDDPKDIYNVALADRLKEYGIKVGEEFTASKKWEDLLSGAQRQDTSAKYLVEKGKANKLRADKQKFTIKEKGIDRRQKISDTFNKDKSVVTATEALNKGKRVREFIERDSKLAPAFVTRALARMAGEVGVMTDKDVAAFRGSPAWTDQLEQLWQQGTKGTLTATNKKVLLNAVDILETAENAVIQDRANFLSSQFAQHNPELSGQQIHDLMIPPPLELGGAPAAVPNKQTGTYSPTQLKKAADKSFGGDLDKAKQYYESKGFKAQ